MPPPLGDYLNNLATELSAHMLAVLPPWLRAEWPGAEADAAVERCVGVGVAAFERRVRTDVPTADQLWASVFPRFLQNERVAEQIGRLLEGAPLNLRALQFMFAQIVGDQTGHPPAQFSGLDFAGAMQEFAGAFLIQATRESPLQDIIQPDRMLQQTPLLAETMNTLVALADLLQEISLRDIVGIQAETITAHNVVSGTQNVYHLAPQTGQPRFPPHWENHYLEALIAHCDRLDMTPLAAGEATTETLPISAVFTTLYLANVTRAADETVAAAISPTVAGTKSQEMGREKEREPITAVAAMANVPRLVILGQPGGGKSTLVNHVAAQLARRRLGQAQTTLPHWPSGTTPLPLRFVLRRFADWLAAEQRSGTAGDVWDYLAHLLESWGCADSFDGLRHTLLEEGGIVFFDGLDEIREPAARQMIIKGAVTAFAEVEQQCRIVVTSRPYAYSEKAQWRLPGNLFPVVSLAPFADEQIEAFNRAWYTRVMGPRRGWDDAQCARRADVLSQTILGLPHLHRLAESPLLLTLIAQVHGQGGTLPENRAELYRQTVDLLLSRWENRIVLDTLPGEDVQAEEVLWLGVPTGQLRDVLAQLAYQAHKRQGETQPQIERAAEISRAELKLALVERFDSGAKAEQIMVYIQHRAGLLVAQEEAVYTFPHRTFQEYLAARYLLNRPNWATLLRNHVRDAPDWWREVFLLGAGIAITTLPDSIPQLLNQLLPFDPGAAEMPLSPEVAVWVMLAAQALVETQFRYHVEQEEEPGSFTAVYRRVQAWLQVVLVADDMLTPAVRAEAGTWLAQVGDDRPGVGVDLRTGLPDIVWGAEVPAGTYTIGDENSEYDDEKSRDVTVERPYCLSCYPITYAQFQCFVDAPDFDDPRWWKKIPAGEKQIREGRFPLANHPRETVSWYQAMAFCRWLDDKLGDPETGVAINLPHEHEWEVAARWPDNRLYPWGDSFDATKANTDEGESIGQTTAVGMYPMGRNRALELYDLSGNVWEWCRNKYDNPEDDRVDRSGNSRTLRGGSWFFNPAYARASFRNGNLPANRNLNFGFRVVVRRPSHDR